MGSHKSGRGGRRFRPYAFTEQGVALLSSILNDERAIEVNIEAMRAFVRIRRLMAFEWEVRQRVEEIENRADEHGPHITALHDTIKQLMTPAEQPARWIGFTPMRVDE